MLLSRFRGYLGEIESDCRTVWTYIFVCITIVRLTTTSRVWWYLDKRRWLPWLRVSKRSVRFGSGCSEMSGAEDSKAVLSWPEERSAFACLFAVKMRWGHARKRWRPTWIAATLCIAWVQRRQAVRVLFDRSAWRIVGKSQGVLLCTVLWRGN